MSNGPGFYRVPKIDQIRRVEEDLRGNSVKVLEKIHGSNGSVLIDASLLGLPPLIAKRSGFLDPGDKFANAFVVIDRMIDRLNSVVLELVGSEGHVRFYGEFYGGLYNRRVDAVCVKIQDKVSYSPKNEFAVFDIVTIDSNNQSRVLSWDRVRELCDKHNVPRVPEICRGLWTI